MSTTPDIMDLVIQDMHARKELGMERYGVPLRTFNGRKALKDLYEELLDACVYIRQEMEERECGKWQAQAETAKELATAWEAENEVLKQKLRLATDFCQVCGKHPPCEHVPNNSFSSLPPS